MGTTYWPLYSWSEGRYGNKLWTVDFFFDLELRVQCLRITLLYLKLMWSSKKDSCDVSCFDLLGCFCFLCDFELLLYELWTVRFVKTWKGIVSCCSCLLSFSFFFLLPCPLCPCFVLPFVFSPLLPFLLVVFSPLLFLLLSWFS